MAGIIHPDKLVTWELSTEATVIYTFLQGAGVGGAFTPERFPLNGGAP